MNTPDWNNFCEATKRFPEGTVGISREIQVRLRDWAVESGLIAPGVVGPVDFYAAVMAQFLGAGCNLQREKTAEEIAAEAQAAADLEARRNAGVIKYEDKPYKKLTDQFVNRDPVAEHNARMDDAFARKQNPELARREQHAQLADRFPAEATPGLVDESWSANEVYVGGHVARFASSQAVEKAKAHNLRVRTEYAERQAAAQAAAANQTKRGI